MDMTRWSLERVKILAVWEDGTSAIVGNEYGKGRCLFIRTVHPGLSHTTKNWATNCLYRDFYPGARQLLGALVDEALGKRGRLVELKNCPVRVEVALRAQEEKKRWVLNLLNYDVNLSRVGSVKVSLRPPHKVKRVFYPYPSEK